PAEPVSQGSGCEQESGEDQRVRIDDPLDHGGAGTELALEGGQGHVQRRDGHDDHHEGEAQHPEQEPAPLMDFGPGVQGDVGHLDAPWQAAEEKRNVSVLLRSANVLFLYHTCGNSLDRWAAKWIEGQPPCDGSEGRVGLTWSETPP